MVQEVISFSYNVFPLLSMSFTLMLLSFTSTTANPCVLLLYWTARKRSALIRDRRSCQPNAPAPRVPVHLRCLRRSPQAGASSNADREDTDWHPPARSERALQPRHRISASRRAQQRWCYDFADPESPIPAVEARKEAD